MAAAVAEWLQARVAAAPHNVAIIDIEGRETTYAALAAEVGSLAARLGAAGIGRGDVVMVVLPSGPKLLTALLATMSVATAFPVNPADRNLLSLVAEIDAKAVVADERLDGVTHSRLVAMGIPIVASDFTGEALGPPRDAPTPVRPATQDAAIMVATSGTTAAPKIVAVSHASLFTSLEQMVSWAGLTASDRSLCLMPLTHLHALLRSTLPVLFAGGSVVVAPGFDQQAVFGWIQRLRPTYLTAAPALFKAMLGRQPGDTGSLRLLVTGSDSIDAATIERIETAFAVPLLQFYVLSEVAPMVAASARQSKPPAGAVGPVQAPWSAVIVDETGAPVAAGAEGEIAIKGGLINPLAGRQPPQYRMTADDRLLTGDLGRLDDAGNLYVLGRVDERIHRGGEKVDPRAVEEVLSAYPGVREAAVFGIPDPTLGQRVAAAVVSSEPAPSAAAIQAFAAAKLFSYMVPERILFVPSLPANAAGKLARARLADALGIADQATVPALSSAMAVDDEIEQQIGDFFRRRLSLPEVQREARFFDLGGDSFGAIELLFEIEERFGVNIPPATFIANNSVAAVAALLRANKGEASALRLVPLNVEGRLPPLFIPYVPEGYVAFAGKLAEALGADQPVHSFNSPRGPDEPAEPERMEEKAAKMIALIKAVQPRGPYYLAGYSFGAHAVYEIAQQLVAHGEAVAFLCVIDDQADLHKRRFNSENMPIYPQTTLNCNLWALHR